MIQYKWIVIFVWYYYTTERVAEYYSHPGRKNRGKERQRAQDYM